jgi:hypothetical protein
MRDGVVSLYALAWWRTSFYVQTKRHLKATLTSLRRPNQGHSSAPSRHDVS